MLGDCIPESLRPSSIPVSDHSLGNPLGVHDLVGEQLGEAFLVKMGMSGYVMYILHEFVHDHEDHIEPL